MTRRLECNGQSYRLELSQERFCLLQETDSAIIEEGAASVAEIRPGGYSVLFASGESVTVDVVANGPTLDVLATQARYQLTLTDPRDRRGTSSNRTHDGPAEVRSIMPGKIIKVLVKEGQAVETGSGLLVVEAMKMQNETKSPKEGVVRRIQAAEGTTVAAGELLLVIE